MFDLRSLPPFFIWTWLKAETFLSTHCLFLTFMIVNRSNSNQWSKSTKCALFTGLDEMIYQNIKKLSLYRHNSWQQHHNLWAKGKTAPQIGCKPTPNIKSADLFFLLINARVYKTAHECHSHRVDWRLRNFIKNNLTRCQCWDGFFHDVVTTISINFRME